MAQYLKIDLVEKYNNSYSVILEEVEYRIEIKYNRRNDGWYLSFYDPQTYDLDADDNSDSMILGGKKLMPNQNILWRSNDDRLPTGVLAPMDTTRSENPAPVSLDNLGTSKQYELIYFTRQQVIDSQDG
ncbi:hypothetical protein [Vibrio phage RYC]|nr:hypothetical protein [Vibrio phage RYC]